MYFVTTYLPRGRLLIYLLIWCNVIYPTDVSPTYIFPNLCMKTTFPQLQHCSISQPWLGYVSLVKLILISRTCVNGEMPFACAMGKISVG